MRPFCCENVFDVIVSRARSLRARLTTFSIDTTTTHSFKNFSRETHLLSFHSLCREENPNEEEEEKN